MYDNGAQGVMYANGEGVPKDDAEAVRWYRLAAEQGTASRSRASVRQARACPRTTPRRCGGSASPLSSYEALGLIYANGAAQGVPKDDAEAVRWFRLAAEQGTARAQFNLGVMYDNGEGVPEDDAEAVRWYRLAAEQGYAAAQLNLGVMYANGEGVPEEAT